MGLVEPLLYKVRIIALLTNPPDQGDVGNLNPYEHRTPNGREHEVTHRIGHTRPHGKSPRCGKGS